VDDATASAPTAEQLRTALLALQKEPLPVSPQEKEGYFMNQVSLGEQMASQGEFSYIYALSEKVNGVQVLPSTCLLPSPFTEH
jgi:import receptor subunit TOM20